MCKYIAVSVMKGLFFWFLYVHIDSNWFKLVHIHQKGSKEFAFSLFLYMN